MDILTLNCGSSSLKYQLYDWDKHEVLARGIVERVSLGGSFIEHYAKGKGTIKKQQDCPDHKVALRLVLATLTDPHSGAIKNLKQIKAVGHRMVHGGEKFAQSVIIDEEALDTFKQLADLAPLHNPPNIMGVEAARDVLPDVPHCAIMDTAWHQTMPPQAYLYALPYSWYQSYGVRRYGFHGTSFLYVAKRAAVLLGRNPFDCNLILLHIGNGASANAVRGGISVDTSMGFTPLEGLVMGTRAGDHDPAIGFYILNKEGLEPSQVETVLNKKSGLLGITEVFTDRRDIRNAAEQGDPRCRLAIDIEAYRLKKYIGAYCAALGRVDALVFTAGVGERGAYMREACLSGLESLGIRLERRRNEISQTRNAETLISTDDSALKVFVIPTDEELVMTEDTRALLEGSYRVHTEFTYGFQSREYRNREREEALKEELRDRPEMSEVIAPVP